MSEAATKSELSQVLEAIQSVQGGIKTMQAQLQILDKKLEIHIATTAERFNTVDEKFKTVESKIEAVRLEVRANNDQLADLAKRQASTDNRLWAFLVALFLTVAGLLAKITLFGKV